MKIESHTGRIPENEDRIFTFFTDLRHVEPLVPKEKLSDCAFTEDSCRLGIAGLGNIELSIAAKEPFSLIRLESGDASAYSFTMWILLKQVAEKDTQITVTLEAGLNPFLQMMAKKPLQQFVDAMVDRMADIRYT